MYWAVTYSLFLMVRLVPGFILSFLIVCLEPAYFLAVNLVPGFVLFSNSVHLVSDFFLRFPTVYPVLSTSLSHNIPLASTHIPPELVPPPADFAFTPTPPAGGEERGVESPHKRGK